MTLARRLLVIGVLLTGVPLVVVGFASWRVGEQAHTAARDGTVQQARSDLDHIVQLAYLACDTTAKAVDQHSGRATDIPDKAAVDDLLDRLKDVKIGRTGYIYILSTRPESRGHYVLSLNRKRDGENLWEARDSDGKLFIQQIVNTAVSQAAGDTGEVRYPWKNAADPLPVMKIVRFKYFPKWQWVIAAGIPEPELFATANEVERLNRTAVRSTALLTIAALLVASVIWWMFSHRLAGRLGPMFAELTEGSRQVVLASGQVEQSAQQLARGATQQAASLQETSACMQQMASLTTKTADDSASAARLMVDVGGRVKHSNEALAQMIGSMSSIQDSSRRVAQIVKTIDEIAFQTNILALNAAVEAARAGESGMGFAVVADEVRSLAQRSAKAARDTAELIEESINRAQDGTQKLEVVEKAIASITSSVTEVKTLIEDTSSASRQQSQGIAQATQALGQVEKITQATAATAEESAAASAELNAQAETSMRTVVVLNTLLVGAVAEPAASPQQGGGAGSTDRRPNARAASRPALRLLPGTGTHG